MAVVQFKAATGATSGNISVTLDAAPTNGNSLLLIYQQIGSTAATMVSSGWTLDQNSTMGTSPGGSSQRRQTWWKTAGAGESATVTVNKTGLNSYAMFVVELAATTKDTSSDSGAQTGTSTPSCVGFTSTTGDECIAFFVGAPTSAQTPTWDDGYTTVGKAEAPDAGAGSGIYVATKTISASTASGTVTGTFTNTINWRGGQYGFTAAVSGYSGTASLTVTAAPTASGTVAGSNAASLTVTAAPTAAGTAGGGVSLTLPVLDLELDGPAFTSITSNAELGLPVLRFTLATPAPYLNAVQPLDEVTATLYERNGVTRIARLRNATGITWQHQLSRPGSASFQVPLDDDTTSEITDRRIVKFQWWRNGVMVAHFACRIRSESTQLAVDGRRWVRFDSQPGVLDLLSDGIIWPEQDLDTTDVTTRWFGFMSEDGPWKVDDDWITPHGLAWSETGDTFRDKLPTDFRGVDRDAEWISAVGPQTTQDQFNFNYFRTHLTLDVPTEVEFLYTADNYPHFYIDGELVASWDPPGRGQWRTAYNVNVHMEAGTHLLAVQVQNSRFSPVQGANPIAWICAARALNPDGSINKDHPNVIDSKGLLLRSDTSWKAHGDSPEPGWHRAQVLRTLISEAADHNYYGPNHIRVGFNNYHDSEGRQWTDRGQYELDIGTVNLCDVIAMLTEAEMDVGINPSDMTVLAWRRKGEDKSADVRLRLGDDNTDPGTLIDYQVDSAGVQYNEVLTQLPIRRWMRTDDDDSISDVGRAGAGLNAAPVGTLGSGGAVAGKLLNEAGKRLTIATARTSTLDGPVPYVHYELGDTITVPNRRKTGTMKARVMAITLDATGETVQVWPEFVEDRSV